MKAARELTADEWQFAKVGRKKGIFEKVEPEDDDESDGPKEWKTRVVEGRLHLPQPARLRTPAPGCALHLHALNTGRHFSKYKPEVCWQVPLRRIDDEQDDGTVISRLTEFGRDGWGEGGEDFAWWCTEAPEAFTGTQAGVRVDVGRAAHDARQEAPPAGRGLPRRPQAAEVVPAGRPPGRGAGDPRAQGSGERPS